MTAPTKDHDVTIETLPARQEKSDSALATTPSSSFHPLSSLLTLGIRERRQNIFDLARWCMLSMDEQNRLNRAHIDRHVVTFQQAYKRASKKNRRASRNLIFLHVPKTGGSTLDNVIPKNYDIKAVIHMNFKSIARNMGALWKEGRLCRVILGHFQLNQIVYQAPTESFAHVVIIREPVSRLVSLYNFLASAKRHPNHKAAIELPFEEFVQLPDVKECHNGQTLRLAGMLRRKRPTDPKMFDVALAQAKENLEHRFTIFGLTERYAEFLMMGKILLHWRDPFYTKRKVTRGKARRVSVNDLSESTLDVVRRQNRHDIELYDWALDLFDRRARKLGITQADVEEFNRRNDAYHELLYDVSNPRGARRPEPKVAETAASA